MRRLIRYLLACGLIHLAVLSLAGAEGVTDSEILIGSSLPLTGAVSAVGQQTKAGIEACFNAVNSAGGIHGRKLRLIAYDDSYDPVPCVRNTQKLIDEDHVFALSSYVGTPTSVKAMRVSQSRGVPVVGLYTGAGVLRKPVNPYTFHVRASYAAEVEAIVAAFVEKCGVRKIAIFYQYDAFGYSVKTATEAALEKRSLDFVALGTYERGSQDVDKAVASIASAAPDAVIMVGTYAPLAKFVRACKAAGLKRTLFHTVCFVGPEAFAADLGAESANCFVTQVMPPHSDVSNPAVQSYVQALAASGTTPAFPGFEAFINARVLAEGLKRAGRELTREKLIHALESIDSGSTTVEMNVGFGPGDHDGLTEAFITHIENGKYAVVTDWSKYRR